MCVLVLPASVSACMCVGIYMCVCVCTTCVSVLTIAIAKNNYPFLCVEHHFILHAVLLLVLPKKDQPSHCYHMTLCSTAFFGRSFGFVLIDTFFY